MTENKGWGPTKSWSWNGFKKDEGYYNKYELSYYRPDKRWTFCIHGTCSGGGNPLTAIYRAFRFRRQRQKEINAWHNRPGMTPAEFEAATQRLDRVAKDD